MLQGSLKETQYDWPDKEVPSGGGPSPLPSKGETLIAQNEITYIADTVSHHRTFHHHTAFNPPMS